MLKKFRSRIWLLGICTVGLGYIGSVTAQPKTDFQLLDLREPAAAKLEKLIPDTSDGKIARILQSGSVLVYDNESMTPVYQKWDASSPEIVGVHKTSKNISGNKAEPFGNPNREFPWFRTAGVMDSEVKTVKFGVFPDKIVVEKKRLTRPHYDNKPDEHESYVWTFPVGTVFGELLLYNNHVFEMRIREKGRSGWIPTVYRAFNSEIELRKELKQWVTEKAHLKSSHPDRTAFEMQYKITRYIAPSGWKPVKFYPDIGMTGDWMIRITNEDDPSKGFMPEDYHPIPTSKENCMKCHQDTLLHADDFDHKRDWYGRIRGSDGIFSFHPFANKAIAGFDNKGKAISFRDELKHLLDIK